MRIVIAGGHGKIALILERLLSQRSDSVAGFIRNPQQIADLEAAVAAALVVDLEKAWADEVAEHLRGADAVGAPRGRARAAARRERRPSTATPPSCWPTPPNPRASAGM